MNQTPPSIPSNQKPNKDVNSRRPSKEDKKSLTRRHNTWIEKELHSLECFEIPIDPRSYLEVIDAKNRYGKNLRLYYKAFQERRVAAQALHDSSSEGSGEGSGEGSSEGSSVASSTESRGGGGDQMFHDFFQWLDDPDDLPEVCLCLSEPSVCLSVSMICV